MNIIVGIAYVVGFSQMFVHRAFKNRQFMIIRMRIMIRMSKFYHGQQMLNFHILFSIYLFGLIFFK